MGVVEADEQIPDVCLSGIVPGPDESALFPKIASILEFARKPPIRILPAEDSKEARRDSMYAPFGILVLLATMPAAEPDITINLQKRCQQAAAEIFQRETP